MNPSARKDFFMGKTTIISITAGIVILLSAIIMFGSLIPAKQSVSVSPTAAPTKVTSQQNTFSYTGEDGKDALRILQEKTSIEQDTSGLVTAINGRKADTAKKEFWAFYVNGKMAQVGPKEYVTKKGDEITWKVENY